MSNKSSTTYAQDLRHQLKAALSLDNAKGFIRPFDTFGPALDALIEEIAAGLQNPVQVIVSVEGSSIVKLQANRPIDAIVLDFEIAGAGPKSAVFPVSHAAGGELDAFVYRMTSEASHDDSEFADLIGQLDAHYLATEHEHALDVNDAAGGH